MMNKNQNGITLIALVITIIVLLILAGVSIAMLTGDNGILSQAVRAGDETQIAEDEEQVNMAIDQYTSEYYDEKYVNRSTSTKDGLGAYVGSKLDADARLEKFVKITKSGSDYEIVTLSTDKDNQARKATYKTANGELTDWSKCDPATGS